MEFNKNEILKISSFTPNLTIYRINDTIYDEIDYEQNMFYIIRRCGVKPYTPNHGYTDYVTDYKILVYPLQSSEIYEEYFVYDDIPTMTSEISTINIIGGVVHENKININLNPKYIEYMELYHGNNITLNTEGRDVDHDSYVYRIKNNAPHEMVRGTFVQNQQSNPTVSINGCSSQNGTPSIDNPIQFKHTGEGLLDNYRISVGQKIKLDDLNSTSNTWYLAQYNTRNYYDLNAIKKMTPSGTAYIDDGLLMGTTELRTLVEGLPLDSFYTVYAKAYVWVEEDCTLQIGSYAYSEMGMWINGRRITYGRYWNGNVPYNITFKKGRNLVEITTYRETTAGGYINLKGPINGVYTEGVPFANYDNIEFLTYHNKWIKNVLTKDNEDFYFMSPVQLKSFGDHHDVYDFAESGSTITQNIKEVTINSLEGFQTEEATNVYSIPAPSDLDGSTLTFDFDTVFESVDYVQSNGTDWYNTLLDMDTENIEVGIHFMLTTNVSGKYLFGSMNSSDTEWFIDYFTGTNVCSPYFGTSRSVRSDTLSLNTWNDLVLSVPSSGTWRQVLNGSTATGTYNGSIQNGNNNPIQLFRVERTSNPNGYIPNGIRVDSFYVRKNGVQVLNWEPVKRISDNQIGFYDHARNIFHYGAGQHVDYAQGNIDVTSNKFNGMKYLQLGSEINDSIAYYDGRLYMYTTQPVATLQSAITDGLTIMYKTNNPQTISVTNPSDVFNNEYEETDLINILPGADALNTWRRYYAGTAVTDNGDGSFTILYPQDTSTDRFIYKEFPTEIGQTYTVTLEGKGNVRAWIANGNATGTRWNIATVRNSITFNTYTVTFTADKSSFRLLLGHYYEKPAIFRNVSITKNGYVPSYIVTDLNGEQASVTLDYTTSYNYSVNKELIEVEAGKSYLIERATSGDVWQVRYRDVDKKIISYTSYFNTNDTTNTVIVPQGAYYLEVMDGNNATTGYSVELIDNEHTDAVITTVNYNNGYDSLTLTLPHELNPGDELVYDINYDEWIYYPLSIDTDFITYSGEDFDPLIINNTNHITISEPVTMTAVMRKKTLRDIERPVFESLTDAQESGNGFGYLEWSEVIGADEYRIYVDDTIIATVDNEIDGKTFSYNIPYENKGKLTIKAANSSLASEKSFGFDLLTVPNTPSVKFLDSVYENNRYYITVEFDVNSKLVDSYNLAYSVDGAAVVVANLEGNPNGENGLTRSYSFTVSNISTGIDVNIYAINETGTNNYMTTAHYGIYNGFTKWTYKQVLHQILLAWTDNVANEDRYLIKYSINNGEWQIAESDGAAGVGTQRLEYLSLQETSSMRVSLTPVIGGQRQIFTKPITVSKATDRTLVPPANFAGVKVRNGLIQFSWDDNYGISDTHFELFYRYSDGTTQTIRIGHASDGESEYTYRINTDTYGFANAKIKMIWELGESEYSNELTIYDLPDADTPPDMHHQERLNGGKVLKISWTPYEFVREYTLSLSINGRQSSIVCYDPYYEYSIPSDQATINVTACVRATNIGGEDTSYSDDIIFTVCNADYRQAQMVYVHAEQEKNVYTTVVGTGLITPYYIYTLSQNHFISMYTFYDKSYKAYLESVYRFEDNYWGHNIGPSGRLSSWISNSSLKTYPIKQIVYQNISTEIPLHYTIFFRTISEYKLYSEFVKMIIACFGDSITAGHPNYWAETGTGDITSQYEYWLSRRLKDEYNVVNKGYGQEKTNDMLERFDRDISGIGAHYCIILGGTNDWYQDASTKDLATGYTVMDGAIDNIKQIVSKCWDNDIYPVVGTLTPRNDITENGKKLFDYFNDWVKEWTTEQSLLGKKCAYVDFFNAGKDLDPPCPLEDPDKPYHLNPLCDYVLHT